MVRKTFARLVGNARVKRQNEADKKKITHRLMCVVKMKSHGEDAFFVVTSKTVLHTQGEKYSEEEPTLLRKAFGFSPEGLEGSKKLPPFQKDFIDWHPFLRDWTHAVSFEALTGEHQPRYDVCKIVLLKDSEFAENIQLS